ncbi:MAG: cytochrome b/b6 domain-containing protein [Planktomarina sp.]|jgi:cytochrome b561|nr:cytochrome b/b6 domain-containing protein [Planktomarina sp.]
MKINENTKYSTNSDYSFLAKLLHWSFIFLFAYGIYKQIDNINELEDIYLLKSEMLFALVFLLFLIFRFFYMTKTQKTSLPADAPKSQRLASKIVHVSMYICLAGIAGSGMMIGYFFWLGLNSGPLIELVIWIHESFVSLIYWLISIHIIAAVLHRLKGDGVWNSMVPFWKEK